MVVLTTVRTETVVRLRGGVELPLQTLCPAEPWVVGQPGQDPLGRPLTGWRLYLAEDADVRPGDQVRVRGVVCSVLGLPASWAGSGLVVEAANAWTATVSLRHPGSTETFNSVSRRTEYAPLAPYATAQAVRLQARVARGAQQGDEQAEETLQVTAYTVTLTVDPTTDAELAAGDVVDVTASPDPLLTGQGLKVTHVIRGDFELERVLVCTLTVPAEVVS